MLFTEIPFLFYFFPTFITIYLFASKNNFLANLVICIFSLIFYASFGINNLPILIIPLIIDYFAALLIDKLKDSNGAKIVLAAAILVNIVLLAYFKYTNFILDNLPVLKLNLKPVIIPLGISFITFQRISYVVDIYRNKVKPTKNFLHYATYATLFPHLISGPIVRFSQIKGQLAKRSMNNVKIFEGTKFFAFGFAFKVLVANQLFLVEDILFQELSSLQFLEALMLILFFTFRIYFDFLGYSLIAIGLAKFIGFDFPENFNSPYQATSINDFWRRWNITLSSWLRDYLYIPLGGNRKGKARTYINLMITMLLGGLWHGASWTFVIWGGIHGTFLVLERIFQDAKIKLVVPNLISKISTFSVVSLAWIIFRFSDLNQMTTLLKTIGNTTLQPIKQSLLISLIFSLPALATAFLWSFLLNEGTINKIKPNFINGVILTIATVFLIFYSLLRKDVPFIYFQF